MAEALVGFLLNSLTTLIVKGTEAQANLLVGVKEEVELLRDDLKLIHSYIKNIDSNPNQAPLTEAYVTQVSDLVLEAEDVIYEYVAFHFQKQGSSFWGNFRWENIKSRYHRLNARRRVAERISSIRSRFNNLDKNMEKIGTQETNLHFCRHGAPSQEGLNDRGKRLPFEETDVIGFDKESKMIIEQLTTGKAERDVIPIVGMGGIGKTTIAAKVYNDPVVKSCFDYRAWVVVSKDYSVRELLEAVIKSAMLLTDEMKSMNDKELGWELHSYLRSARKYLIVLDDVWEPNLWEELQCFFPNNITGSGSRIILTTRNNQVALSAKPSNPPIYLNFLNDGESWKLLCLRVFQKQECPEPKLEEPGKKIAKECGGLPLAIVVIAGVLLKRERTTKWWSLVSSRVHQFINEQHTRRCEEIFSLSYKDLPHHLRPCFIYLGLFPEDYEISAKQLLLLWLAEGFIPEKEQMSPEEVAYDCLQELADRNLVQVATQEFDRSIRSCRVHDLLREFCISEASKDKFLAVYRPGHSSLPVKLRRLGIHSDPLQCITSSAALNLRSLICFEHNDNKRLSSKHWKLLCKEHMLLRVLDLWDVYVEDIPNDIYNFICLRYLRLKSDTAETLPSTICNLWNLETLDVTAPMIERPQINIWKLDQLRHFYFNGEAILKEPPSKMIEDQKYLKNLQTLSSISPENCTSNILQLMPNLVKLGIYGDIEKSKDLVFKNISKLQKLQMLKLIRDRRRPRVNSLPSEIEFPRSLIKLTLSQTDLKSDLMDVLGKRLPNLQVLKLKDGAYGGEMLNCTQGGFPRLEVLKLVNLGITKWKISQGSMPNLRTVVINRCAGLKDLPSSMKQMRSFQELELWHPNVSVTNCAREIEKVKYQDKDQFKLLIHHAENGDDMH